MASHPQAHDRYAAHRPTGTHNNLIFADKFSFFNRFETQEKPERNVRIQRGAGVKPWPENRVKISAGRMPNVF